MIKPRFSKEWQKDSAFQSTVISCRGEACLNVVKIPGTIADSAVV